MGLRDRLKFWGFGGTTGFNATENNIKMTIVIVAPFLGLWLAIRVIMPEPLYDMAVTVSVFIWLAYIFMLYSWAKSDASGFLPFPQSKWKFPDGTCRTFDLKVPPDSWEKICDLPDGKVAYKVYFSERLVYQDPDLPFSDVFDVAYWILPDLWDKSFQRRAFGEFFHRGVFVTHPACEDISVYVLDWETKEGERFPVCLVNDCALTYFKALHVYNTPQFTAEGVDKAEATYVLYRDGRKREGKLLDHSAYLEDRLEIAEKESSEDFKKSADSRLKAIRARHARIMSTKQPLLTRLLNLKILAWAIFFLSALAIVGRMLGWW